MGDGNGCGDGRMVEDLEIESSGKRETQSNLLQVDERRTSIVHLRKIEENERKNDRRARPDDVTSFLYPLFFTNFYFYSTFGEGESYDKLRFVVFQYSRFDRDRIIAEGAVSKFDVLKGEGKTVEIKLDWNPPKVHHLFYFTLPVSHIFFF